MKIIKIKQKKQDNGLWGTPYNCYYIDSIPFDDRKILIFSAAIAAFNEKYNQKFRIVHCNENGFKIRTGDTDNSFGNYYSIFYDKYEVVDDTLYEFFDNQEHIIFLRQQKLKKLQYENR